MIYWRIWFNVIIHCWPITTVQQLLQRREIREYSRLVLLQCSCCSNLSDVAVSGGGPRRPQCPISLLPQQLGGADQHHRHTHHQPCLHPVHQPAACSRGPPDSQRPAPHVGQLHPHRHLRHRQRLRHAPQPARRTRPRDSGSRRRRGTPVSRPLHQPHHSRQPHEPPAGGSHSGLEARTDSRGQPRHPCGGGCSRGQSGGPGSGPRARPAQPGPATHHPAAERLRTADVQLLEQRLEVQVTSHSQTLSHSRVDFVKLYKALITVTQMPLQSHGKWMKL